MSKLLSPAKTEVLFMGNEAIARGALEAGLSVASGYPGTPSSEAWPRRASSACRPSPASPTSGVS